MFMRKIRAKKYQIIREELKKYQPELLGRPEIIALTKTEGMDSEIIKYQVSKIQEKAGDVQVFAISSNAHLGVKDVLRALEKRLKNSGKSKKKVLKMNLRKILP